ncbi:MAG: hypothetical protein IJI61_07040 [Oscillospiraceae bacterium]|nr:hypothetical protein [Oscillospiraceae bacterium]
MKRITALLCTILFLFVCPNFALAEEPAWSSAYRAVLEESCTLWEQVRNDAAVENSYTLWDMDNDSIPELILKSGTCEADYMAYIYTCRDSAAVRIDTIGAGHCVFYGDGAGEGLIVYWGHMGCAEADRYRITENSLSDEFIFEDNLNPRLETDPDAEYLPLTDFVPAARYLTLVEANNPLLLEQYFLVSSLLDGCFTAPAETHFPQNDEDFFLKVISNDLPIFAAATNRFANTPGTVSFRNLLQRNIASPWMSGDLEIQSMQTADLNSDGQLECILELACADGSSPVRFYLSEQEGTVYVYIENYTYSRLVADPFGNLIVTSLYAPDQPQLMRLIFNKENSFLLTLPAT